MTKQFFALLSSVAIVGTLGLRLDATVFAQSETPAATSIGNKTAEVSRPTKIVIHGKIVAVDKDEKLGTLEGPDNRKVTLKVDNPYNLQAAKVGEPVVVQFYEVATIRKKQPGENIPSASVKEGIVSAVQSGVPGGTAVGVSIVVSVVAIDEADGTITVKGPDQAVETVKARDPKSLTLLKVGDQLVVSLSRAIVISLDKQAAG